MENSTSKDTVQKVIRGLKFVFIIALVTLIMLELISWALFKSFTQKPYDAAQLVEDRETRILEFKHKLDPQPNQSNKIFKFHPYFGYDGLKGSLPWGEGGPTYNDYGVLSTQGHAYPYKKQDGDLVIGICGGSVAEIFANYGEPYLQTYLQEQHGFTGRVVFINLALSGYKQPQQLYYLQYALLSGFEFDIILNLDGFNDLVLARNNMMQQANPLFPSTEHFALMGMLGSLQESPNRKSIALLNSYYLSLNKAIGILRFGNSNPYKHSRFVALLTEILSQRSQMVIDHSYEQMAVFAQELKAPSFSGPPLPGVDNGYPVTVWHQASLQMDSVALQYGLTYLHVLQPNQYLEGSKPLTENEKKVAYDPTNAWGQIIRNDYKQMIASGTNLKGKGVAFYDFTDVFQNVNEDLYTDTCCHFNVRGNELLAYKLGQFILEEHQRQQTALNSAE